MPTRGGEAGTNYWAPVVRKGVRCPIILHMLYISVVTLFIDCANLYSQTFVSVYCVCLNAYVSLYSVKYWADELGEELWQLGQSVNRATDMQAVSSLKLRIMHASFCVVTNMDSSHSTEEFSSLKSNKHNGDFT